MAEGRSNRSIAARLQVELTTVERHITSIFGKLDLRSNDADHRRVLAVIRYLSRSKLLPQPFLTNRGGAAQANRRSEPATRRVGVRAATR